jgi:hypothetical protein
MKYECQSEKAKEKYNANDGKMQTSGILISLPGGAAVKAKQTEYYSREK